VLTAEIRPPTSSSSCSPPLHFLLIPTYISLAAYSTKHVQNNTIQLLSAEEVKQMPTPGFNLEDKSCSGLMKYE